MLATEVEIDKVLIGVALLVVAFYLLPQFVFPAVRRWLEGE